MNIFEQAARKKLRFSTVQGSLTVEDLWDMSLQTTNGRVSLDDIARSAYRQIQDRKIGSFVVETPNADEAMQLTFDLVKHVIDVRLAERDAAALAAANKEKKQKLLEILARKEDEGLSALSVDELRTQINAL